MGKPFFCEGKEHHRDADEHGFHEVGSLQYCEECLAEREEALSQFKAELVREHVEATEKRHVH